MSDLSSTVPVAGALPIRSQSTDMRSASSATSWGAILAGALGAAALSLVLLILGSGLGLTSVSPWSSQGASAATLSVAAIVWLSFMQLAASGMGGYLAGRLRARWPDAQPDEIYFRDTAHGFLAWALASVATAALLSGVVASIVGSGAQGAATLAGGAANAAATAGASVATISSDAVASRSSGATGYFVDSLLRRGAAAANPSSAAPAAPTADTSAPMQPNADSSRTTAEASRILSTALADGTLPAADAQYLGGVVAQQTGLSQADAEKRVVDTFARMQAKVNAAQTSAREAADKARKASAYASLWMVVSLLLGAFVACLAATYGGRHRDQY